MTSIPVETIKDYAMVQTFYADPQAVNNSSEINITSVELFFKAKPDRTKNASGKANPGVTVTICQVSNDEPDLTKCIHGVSVRRSFDEIYSFSDASSPTTFSFLNPVKLPTGRFYGIVVIFEDPAFELWTNKQGDKLVNTNTPSSGSNIVKDGKLYLNNNSGVYKAISDTDLKFAVNVAKYVSNTVSGYFTNKDYEFFTTKSRVGGFLTGEYVYKRNVANSTSGKLYVTAGSNVIRGNGATSFNTLTVGQPIVIYGNSTVSQVKFVLNISNSTYMTVSSPVPFTNGASDYKTTSVVGKVYYKDEITDRMYLVDSSANTTYKFAVNDGLIGVDSRATCNVKTIEAHSVDRVKIKGSVKSPAAGTITNFFNTAYFNPVTSTYLYDANKAERIDLNNILVKNLNRYDGFILSRSLEVDNANLFDAFSNIDNAPYPNRKSLKIDTTLKVSASNTGLFYAPTIEKDNIDIYTLQNIISNTYTTVDANGVTIDTEVGGNGIAASRYIATKVTFANNRFAEDIRVYMTAYRPANTELKVYARVHNSADPEAFDDKAWTPLIYVENGTKFSSTENENDFIEFELGLPNYHESAANSTWNGTLPGVYTTELSNNIIAATDDPTTYVANNDLIKIYNPLIPEDYIVAIANTVSATNIVLGTAISNNNLVGTGFVVDRLKYKNVAFNNITNDNVARYYSSSLVEYDKFDSMQIKIVMLSDTTYKVPKVDQIQVIGVSA